MLFPLPSSPALSTDTADTPQCLETMCSRTFSTRAHDHAQTLAPPPPILLSFCLMTTEPQPQLSKGLTSERLQTAQQLLVDSRGRKQRKQGEQDQHKTLVSCLKRVQTAFFLSTTGISTGAPQPAITPGLLLLHSTAGKTIGLLVFHRFHFRAILQPDDLNHGMNYLARSVLLQRGGVLAKPRKTKATYA